MALNAYSAPCLLVAPAEVVRLDSLANYLKFLEFFWSLA